MSAPAGAGRKHGNATVTTATITTSHDLQQQEPCTFSFVDTHNESSSSSTSSSLSSTSLVSGLSLGLALLYTTSSSGCTSSSSSSSSSGSGCDGTALDWTLLGALVFQLFFFSTVVWQGLRSFFGQRKSNIYGFGIWGWVCIRNWLGKLIRNWVRNGGRSSIGGRPGGRTHASAAPARLHL